MYHLPNTSESSVALSEKELAALPHSAHIPLAVRCAQRVFPLVGIEGNFYFWNEEAGYYVDAIECARLVGRLMACGHTDILKASRVLPDEISQLIFKEVKRAVQICPSRAHFYAHIGIYASVSSAVYIGESFPGGAASSATSASILASRLLPDLGEESWTMNLEDAVLLANRRDYENLKEHSTWLCRIRGLVYDGLFEQPLFPEESGIQNSDLLVSEVRNAFLTIDRSATLDRWERMVGGAYFDEEEALQLIEDWYIEYRRRNVCL